MVGIGVLGGCDGQSRVLGVVMVRIGFWGVMMVRIGSWGVIVVYLGLIVGPSNS